MKDKLIHARFNLAKRIAMALDDPFDRMMKSFTIELTYEADSMQVNTETKILKVSPDFIQKSSIPLLISVLMHEARHWTLEHSRKWKETKLDILTIHLMDEWFLELKGADGEPDMYLLSKIWNVAADCEIYQKISHLPIVRKDAAMMAGQYPCSNLSPDTVDTMFWELISKPKNRREILDYMRGKNEDNEQAGR